jgi:hypothetical protein
MIYFCVWVRLLHRSPFRAAAFTRLITIAAVCNRANFSYGDDTPVGACCALFVVEALVRSHPPQMQARRRGLQPPLPPSQQNQQLNFQRRGLAEK